MKISLVQPDTVWENKQENFRSLELLVSPWFNQTDIVILPEMFTTGFSVTPENLEENPGEETYEWMKNMAIKGNFAICGTYIVRENNRLFNRFVFVSPENTVWNYDKRHLFGQAGEDQYFSPGKERVVFTFRNVRISPFICYDLRFPIWNRSRNDVDLIIYSANWPDKRSDVWNLLLKARAIENQCYVAGVNRTGTDGNGIKYSGESAIIHPYGNIIVSADPDQECAITGEISIPFLDEFRKKFPVMNDADDFSINL